jgi:hypothetical protein
MVETPAWVPSIESGGGQREQPFSIEKVELLDGDRVAKSDFHFGESLCVSILYCARPQVERPHFIIGIGRRDGSVDSGSLFAASMLLDGRVPERLTDTGILECEFDGLALLPGTYYVDISVRTSDGLTALLPPKTYLNFRIASQPGEYGFVGEFALSMSRYTAPVVVDYEWRW